MSEPSDLIAASAALVAAAVNQADGDKTAMLNNLADYIVLAADAANILAAATNSPAVDKYPQTVVGIITVVEGNRVEWTDVGGDRQVRQAFAGADAVSRHAANTASKLVGRKARISFGFVRGQGAKGETDIRRLVRVSAAGQPANNRSAPRDPAPASTDVPLDHGVPRGASAEPARTYTAEEQAPFAAPAATATAVVDRPVDENCPDLPEEIWRIQRDAEDAGDLAVAVAHLRAALRVLGKDQAPLASWSAQRGFRYDRPGSFAEFSDVVNAISAIWCGRMLP